MYTKKEREHYNITRERVCEALSITQNQYNWYRRAGEKLHKLYEDNCNGTFLNEELYEKATQTIEELVNKRATEQGLFVYFQTDPRGATIYLDNKKIPDNNYTQAHCIY